MKKARLIAIDLDGTLLDDAKKIPKANMRALREACRRGVPVAIASGRMLPRIEPIEAELGIDSALIAYNGAKVVGRRAEGRPTIRHEPLPAGVARELIQFTKERGYLLNFYLDDRLYAEDGGDRRRFREIYSKRTGAEYHLTDLARFIGLRPTKLILLADPPERDRLYEEFAPRLAGRATVTKSDPEYLEIMAPGVDKGSALPALAACYGVGLDEVLAIGDADNDAPMIRAAGIGVALANATDLAKAEADYVTRATNNEGGVAEAVELFVLG